MRVKYTYLYLYLALACLLGIILIFVFDGYMGIHDTLTIASGEMPVKIEADQWRMQEKDDFMPSTSVINGGKAYFTYEIANRSFSSLQTDIEVSVWQNQVKVADILSSTLNVEAFGNGQAEWTLDTVDFVSENQSAAIASEFTVMIKRGDIERKVIFYIYTVSSQGKVIPIEPPY